jgi:large subunit ribosomal protein L35Ae
MIVDTNGRPANASLSFYLGKKVAYVYRGQKEIRGTKIRVIWGKVTRPHGKYHDLHGATILLCIC